MSRALASEWERLGDPPPEALADARLQLHHAVQLLAAFGDALVPPRPDYSHSAVTWDPGRRALVSETAGSGSGPGFRVALFPARITLGLLAGGAGEPAEGSSAEAPAPAGPEFPLRGRTLDQALEWLHAELAARIGPKARLLARPQPEIPAHPVSDGAPFDAGEAALAELERWYHDAHLLLEEVRTEAAAQGLVVSAVRCWPHHFDIATLITLDLDPDIDPEEARSIGAGMTPGDDSYAEPYFYVTPWPYPDPLPPDGLPRVPAPALWHTEGWVGSVLRGTDLVAAAPRDVGAAGDMGAAAEDGSPGREVQAELASRYARASVEACRTLLEG